MKKWSGTCRIVAQVDSVHCPCEVYPPAQRRVVFERQSLSLCGG